MPFGVAAREHLLDTLRRVLVWPPLASQLPLFKLADGISSYKTTRKTGRRDRIPTQRVLR